VTHDHAFFFVWCLCMCNFHDKHTHAQEGQKEGMEDAAAAELDASDVSRCGVGGGGRGWLCVCVGGRGGASEGVLWCYRWEEKHMCV
jgi:hypothetical protein